MVCKSQGVPVLKGVKILKTVAINLVTFIDPS
ncbi:hypothetical protein E2C01_100802 [Portunus trituberculatus]|uniref:Uncharacterized protein n=1 Tax=Portunus trituberculatus TaxID=210409 RepID=A0A5B7KEI5_PORTR|nr:hypothetical protein [Portunus trituberculatus]